MQKNYFGKQLFFNTIVLGVLFILISNLVVPNITMMSSVSGEMTTAGTIWYVDDDAPNDPGPCDPTLSDPLENGSLDHPFDMIQEALNETVSGDTVFVFNGTYVEKILILIPISLIGENKEMTIIDGNELGHVVTIGPNDVVLSGFTITNCGNREDAVYLSSSDHSIISGNIITQNNGAGIKLRSSEYNIISDNLLIDNEYGIYLDTFSHHNTIEDNIIYEHDDDWTAGIVVKLAHNNTIKGNTFVNASVFVSISGETKIIDNTFTAYGVTLHGDTGSVYSSTVMENNTINDVPIRHYKHKVDFTIPENTAQVILVYCNNVTIQNLVLSKVTNAIFLATSRNCNITNNQISQSGTAIYFYFMCRGNTIRDNTITNNEYGITINFWSPKNNKILSNTIEGNNENGITLYGAAENLIQGNTIRNNNKGIRIEETWDSASNNTIVENLIENNDIAGLYMLSTDDNIIKYNTIRMSDMGIFNLGGDRNTIAKNHIENNWQGIKSGSSDNNTIYHNNFYNNSQVAYETGDDLWYHPILRQGNYYDIYPGEDLNGDGIGDDPFHIPPGDTYDEFPLIRPWTRPPFRMHLMGPD